MIDFTHNPIIPADYTSRGRGLPYEASPLAEMLFLQIKLHDAAVWKLEGGVVGVFDI